MEENQVDTKIVEPTLTEQPQTAQPNVDTEETPQQIDWRRFKEARKKERMAMEEAQKQAAAKAKEAEALKAALDALVNKPSQSYSQSQETTDESEDERIQRLVDERIEKKERAREEERKKQEMEQSFPTAMKTFSDFKDVYTQENCDYLEYHHPELFAALKDEPDSMQKWTKVYNAMKRYIPNAASSNKDMKKAERNLSKPQSMAVGGVTNTADQAPKMLNDKVKQDNWRRMQARIKGL